MPVEGICDSPKCHVIISAIVKIPEQRDQTGSLRRGPMLGFKRFTNAAIIISGIELLRRIQKGQFDLLSIHLKGAATPTIWNAVLGF